MKKIYLLFAALALASFAFSQALPNPSFDNWSNNGSFDDPDDWNTLNSSTSTLGVLTAYKATGADVHSGPAAIRLITQFVPIININANGLATTGSINVQLMTIEGGIPYTMRPDSIAGWFKYNPQGADFGFVDFALTDGGNPEDTVGFAHFQTPNAVVGSYTYFSVPVNYYNTNTPVISRCIISSSQGVTSVVNSEMFIDDLSLVFNPDGVREPVFGKNNVKFNSVSRKLDVYSTAQSNIRILDITGKEVFKAVVKPGHSSFTLDNIPTGLYLYQLGDSFQHAFTGKLIAE